MADIYVKWEGANPTGSMKDRMAWSIVTGAESRGDLKPGGTLVDYTGGSTGSSIAMVCAARGFRSHFVSSNAFAESKLRTMRAFGAQLDIVPSEDGKITKELIQHMIELAADLAKRPGYVAVDQFNNLDNRNAYHEMAREVMSALNGNVHAFVAGVGTGGCFTGNAEYLKDRIPDIKCYPVEPYNSQPISGKAPTGGHRLEGMGAGFVPGIFRPELADTPIAVTDEDAIATARNLARQEGIFGGTSSGANLFAALKVAKELGPGHNVVTVVCDSGLKYLEGDLYGDSG